MLNLRKFKNIENSLAENIEVQTALSADNTVSNKEAFVFKKMEEEIAKYFTDSYDFYEKIQKDDIKSSIFKTIYKNITEKRKSA